MKDKAKQAKDNTTNVLRNAEQLAQASALLIVAGFSYWALGQLDLPKLAYYTVLGALVIIGLRGAVEFVKFLNRK